MDEEISKLHSSGLMVEVSGEVFIFEVEFIRSMNDGKMQKLLLGRGGAFCILCPHTQEEVISLQQIKDGFEMGEVEIDELNLLYDDLVYEDGNVVKRRGDYGERLGLTQCPIIQPCTLKWECFSSHPSFSCLTCQQPRGRVPSPLMYQQ